MQIHQEEELDYDDYDIEQEEGEIVDKNLNSKEDEGYDLDKEISTALELGDVKRAEALLSEKETRCKALKVELRKEQSREDDLKKKKISELQAKFKQLQRTEAALNKSIASS